MKRCFFIAISSVVATSVFAAPAVSADFLIRQMAAFYCGAMQGENPKNMESYDRGLIEGMSLGFVMGKY